MATWQQGINSGGFLAGIGGQNSNAPKASDVSEALAYIRQNNEMERSGRNNIGLQALQGLGSVAQTYQAAKQQEVDAAFQKEYAAAIQSGDRQQVRDLMTKYPGQLEKIQSGMKWADEDQRNSIGTLAAGARLAASSPEAMQSWLQNNANELARVGVDPNNVAQMYQQNPSGFGEFVDYLGMAALGPIDYFNVQDKMAGREIDRGRLAETIRSNQAGEALQARGQNLSYQSAMTGHGLAAERLALDKQKFGFEVQQAQKKAEELINAAPKLSVNMEKAIEKSAGDAAASRNAADSMTTLADTLEKEKPTPGLFGNAENMFSKLTGQDNYLRDMRIRFNQLANAQATKLLPPGPASDKDIEFARKGIPSETDNPMVMARWLRGMAKMESNNAKFNEFRSEWMSANGSPGQSDRNRNIMGMDVKKGESLNSAAKRFLSSSYGDSQPQQQLSDDELISKYLGGQ
ncbi:DNA transfer protein [Escherichia coli]|uniref:phage DNA ejection protein n=1 Tax=Escherichia coli TaxID=562 RepID=UPI000B7DCDED|nr:phage DNA ejection protein [Escherichia coli]EER4905877.1 acyltransferase [Escherichia coli]EEU3304567.1 acyltransferase [Escherichia coli]EEV3571674.1 acyltransferase [Escherichia coli]EFC9280638.1 acyltransferase [Escherichia coli]EFG0216016.1 acyltransferase [Escherichia coli]